MRMNRRMGLNSAGQRGRPVLVFLSYTSSPYDKKLINDTGAFVLEDFGDISLGGYTNYCAFSQDGSVFAAAVSASPYVKAYSRSVETFTEITGLSPVPGAAITGVAVSPDGSFLAVGVYNVSPYLAIYKRGVSGQYDSTITPDVAPTVNVTNLHFSRNGSYLLIEVAGATNSFILYSISGDTFTKVADPATSFYTVNPCPCEISADGAYLVFAPGPVVYKNVSGVLTRLPDAAIPIVGQTKGIVLNANGNIIAVGAVGASATQYLWLYELRNDILVKLDDPATMPSYWVSEMCMTPDDRYLICQGGSDANLYVYRRRGGILTFEQSINAGGTITALAASYAD